MTGAAALVNIVLNLALIPSYGMIGAAVATVAAYATMAIGMAWWSQRIYPVPYQWRRVATAALAAVASPRAGAWLDGGLVAAFALTLAYPFAARPARLHEPAERRRLTRLVTRAVARSALRRLQRRTRVSRSADR